MSITQDIKYIVPPDNYKISNKDINYLSIYKITNLQTDLNHIEGLLSLLSINIEDIEPIYNEIKQILLNLYNNVLMEYNMNNNIHNVNIYTLINKISRLLNKFGDFINHDINFNNNIDNISNNQNNKLIIGNNDTKKINIGNSNIINEINIGTSIKHKTINIGSIYNSVNLNSDISNINSNINITNRKIILNTDINDKSLNGLILDNSYIIINHDNLSFNFKLSPKVSMANIILNLTINIQDNNDIIIKSYLDNNLDNITNNINNIKPIYTNKLYTNTQQFDFLNNFTSNINNQKNISLNNLNSAIQQYNNKKIDIINLNDNKKEEIILDLNNKFQSYNNNILTVYNNLNEYNKDSIYIYLINLVNNTYNTFDNNLNNQISSFNTLYNNIFINFNNTDQTDDFDRFSISYLSDITLTISIMYIILIYSKYIRLFYISSILNILERDSIYKQIYDSILDTYDNLEQILINLVDDFNNKYNLLDNNKDELYLELSDINTNKTEIFDNKLQNILDNITNHNNIFNQNNTNIINYHNQIINLINNNKTNIINKISNYKTIINNKLTLIESNYNITYQQKLTYYKKIFGYGAALVIRINGEIVKWFNDYELLLQPLSPYFNTNKLLLLDRILLYNPDYINKFNNISNLYNQYKNEIETYITFFNNKNNINITEITNKKNDILNRYLKNNIDNIDNNIKFISNKGIDTLINHTINIGKTSNIINIGYYINNTINIGNNNSIINIYGINNYINTNTTKFNDNIIQLNDNSIGNNISNTSGIYFNNGYILTTNNSLNISFKLDNSNEIYNLRDNIIDNYDIITRKYLIDNKLQQDININQLNFLLNQNISFNRLIGYNGDNKKILYDNGLFDILDLNKINDKTINVNKFIFNGSGTLCLAGDNTYKYVNINPKLNELNINNDINLNNYNFINLSNSIDNKDAVNKQLSINMINNININNNSLNTDKLLFSDKSNNSTKIVRGDGSLINANFNLSITNINTILYSFSSFTFTNLNIIGRLGSSLSTYLSNSSYSNNSWILSINNFNVINGIQYWTIPESNYYLFEICGSNGYDFSDVIGGRGRIIYGIIYLKKDQKLKLLVGQQGISSSNNGIYNAGGSGASYVVNNDNELLFVAGAGGNSFVNPNSNTGFTKLYGIHAPSSIYGTDQYGLIKKTDKSRSSNKYNILVATGGTFNYDGKYTSNDTNIINSRGLSFLNGGYGGYNSFNYNGMGEVIASGTSGGFGGGSAFINFNIGSSSGGYTSGDAGPELYSLSGAGGSYWNNKYVINGCYGGLNNTLQGYIKITKTNILTIPDLYDFNTFTFTNGGKSGNIGISLYDVLKLYTSFNWVSRYISMDLTKQGIQKWIVPITGTYTFTVSGVKGYKIGSYTGGRARIVTGKLNLKKFQQLYIIIGQNGTIATSSNNGTIYGGNGATFVFDDNFLYFISASGSNAISNGLISSNGIDAPSSNYSLDYLGNIKTTNLNLSGLISGSNAGSGATYNNDGKNNNISLISKNILNGGQGGNEGGGFGGGGSYSIIGYGHSGGNGGYSGGDAGIDNRNSTCGGSYFNTNIVTNGSFGVLSDNEYGYVKIVLDDSSYPLLIQPSLNNELYSFTSITFTNCGSTGMYGPTFATCKSYYSSYSWIYNTDFFNMITQGIQIWTVPKTGTYEFDFAGGAGGIFSPGSYTTLSYAVRIRARLNLNLNDKLCIVVGQKGDDAYNQNISVGGGGGTFIYYLNSSTPLLIAGGGGGACYDGNGQYLPPVHASFSETPNSPGPGTYGYFANVSIASGGYGGYTYSSTDISSFYGGGAGGAGWYSNGQDRGTLDGQGGRNKDFGFIGGIGGGPGIANGYAGSKGKNGGFGGGGGGGGSSYPNGGPLGCGAGGGWNGGSTGTNNQNNPGGSSYVTSFATNRTDIGYNASQGFVTITAL